MSDKLHPGWHILLQHPAITKQQLLVCQLLCVSGSMRSALHEAAAGQVLCRIIGSNDKAPYVPWGYWEAQGATAALLASTAAVLPVSETTAESFRAWLVQHARLLHTLDLGCKPETPEATAVTAAAGRGLLGAAAGADQPLLLQGYRGCWDDTLLQHLPAATLTYLSITDDNGQSEQMWKEYAALGGNFGPVCGSNQALLKRFSKLRHLGVVEHPDLDTRNVSALLPALGVMMQLTCLMLSAGRGMEQHFQHLPVSLVEMCLGGPEDDRPDASLQSGECWEDCCKRLFKPINFSHLTSLTSLLLYHDVWAFRVRQGDVLPPNVLKLSAGFAQSWEPVLQLSHLQKLYAVAAPREVLNCMPTRLSSLQAFHETWAGWQQWSVEDIEMLAKLPTRELSCTRLSAPALLQLSRLTGLTSMEIGLSDAAVWQQLPAPLGRLTQLVKVSVSGPDWEHEEQENALTSLSGSLPVATALAALPALRSVDLHCLCFSCEAVVALAAATALTSLMLTRAGLQDSGVITLVTNKHATPAGFEF